MKKFLPIIVGVLGGIVASVGVANFNTAHSELNLWNDIIAYGDVVEWNEVFSPASRGKNLYNLAYQNLIISPQKNALTEVAQKNGLSPEEAKQVIDGDILPLYGKNGQRSANLTQQDAYILMRGMQDDYDLTKEIFDIQREIDMSIKPGELFSNGDLSDSGFDLIHDLNKIEEIMFVEVTKTTVGKPYGGFLPSPFLPTDDDQSNEFYVPNQGDAAVISLNFDNGKVKISPKTASDDFGSTYAPTTVPTATGDEMSAHKTVFDLGDEEVKVNVLDDDFCNAEDPFSSALDEYEEKAAAKIAAKDSVQKIVGTESESFGGESSPVTSPTTGAIDLNTPAQYISSDGTVNPAPADKWLSEWCPQLLGGKGTTNSPSSFGLGNTGFSSLGGSSNDFVAQTAEKSSALNNKFIAVSAGVCFSIKLIKKKAITFQPGESCVLCEVKRINETLRKTLSHSLIPNKVTGNYMESAKCKKSFQPLLDLNIFTIKSPIPTPPGNDKIFGRNIFDEFKKSLHRYRPFYLDAEVANTLTKKALNSAPASTSQEDVVSSINKELSKAAVEAEEKLNALSVSSSGLNMVEYARSMILELRNLRIFFQNYKTLVDDMVVTCQKTGAKNYLD